MAGLSMDQPWAFAIGILGNIISFMVYLAPLPTFYRVYRKKSTEGFQSVPYVVALFSAMLWIYYAFLKSGMDYILITINLIGCIIETTYIMVFLFYAPKNAKIFTSRLFCLLNVVVFGSILLITLQFSEGSKRAQIVGWICVGFSMIVFVAPLSILKLVMETKSVEFMPFSLSCSLTVSAVVWFLYGLLIKDIHVALPNTVGFLLGVVQMAIYLRYKNTSSIAKENGLPEHIIMISVGAAPGSELVHPIDNTRSGGEEENAPKQETEGSTKESVGAQEESEMSQLEV